MKAKWSVLAVYENAAARQFAMEFCDVLVGRFWTEFSFELSWYAWSELEEEAGASRSALQAREADLIVMAIDPKGGSVPTRVSTWLEHALSQRGDREGVLVGLPVTETGLRAEVAATQLYLRKLAHRNGMDYLTAVPEGLPHRAPESFDSYNLRATQVTAVLDTILHHSPPPHLD